MKLYMKMMFLMLVALCTTTTIPTGHACPPGKDALRDVSSVVEASLPRVSVSSEPMGPKTSPVHVSVSSEPKGPMGPKASPVRLLSEVPKASPQHVASEPMATPMNDAPDTSPEHVSSESERPMNAATHASPMIIAPKASAKPVFSVTKAGPSHVSFGPKPGPMDVVHTAAEPDPDDLY